MIRERMSERMVERAFNPLDKEPIDLEVLADVSDKRNILHDAITVIPDLEKKLVGMGFENDNKREAGDIQYKELGEKVFAELRKLLGELEVNVATMAEQAGRETYYKHDAWYFQPTDSEIDGKPTGRIIRPKEKPDFKDHEYYFDSDNKVTEHCCIFEQLVNNTKLLCKYHIEDRKVGEPGQNLADFLNQRINAAQNYMEILQALGDDPDPEVVRQIDKLTEEIAAIIIEAQRIKMRKEVKVAIQN